MWECMLPMHSEVMMVVVVVVVGGGGGGVCVCV